MAKSAKSSKHGIQQSGENAPFRAHGLYQSEELLSNLVPVWQELEIIQFFYKYAFGTVWLNHGNYNYEDEQ